MPWCVRREWAAQLHGRVADVVSKTVIVGVSKVRKGSVKKPIPLTENVLYSGAAAHWTAKNICS